MPSFRDLVRRSALCAAVVLALFAPALRAADAARTRPVLVVCWDGASWPLLGPFVEARRLPTLGALLARGRAARLSSFEPALAAPLATTLVTGLAPEAHGIADASELDPAYGRLRAATALSRAVPAIWDVASARSLEVAVVGWPASWPAGRVSGTLLSDRLMDHALAPDALRGFPALAWPDSAAGAALRLVPKSRARGAVADLAERLRVRFAAAMEAAARADLTLVWAGEPAESARLLYDPATSGAPDGRTLPADVESLFVLTDQLLGPLVAQHERRGGDVFIVSTAGLKWTRPGGAAFAPAWRTPEGILVASGPDVIASRVRTQASIFDIVPTIARLLGLPLDPRAGGSVLSSWISAGIPPAPARRRWDEVVTVRHGASGVEPATSRRDSAEHARRLASLGYLVPTGPFTPSPDAPLRSPAADANVAVFLRAKGRVDEAVARLRRAVAAAPKTPPYRDLLSDILESQGRFGEADEEAIAAAKARGADGPRALVERANRRIRAGKRPDALMLLMRARTRVAEPGREISLAYGRVSLDVGHHKEALRIARLLVRARPKDAASWTLLADASEKTGAAPEAGRARARAAALSGGKS